MALDLFVNYERSTNSNIFYRPASALTTFAVKLSNRETVDAKLNLTYYAEISINNGAYTTFVADGNEHFKTSLTFDTTTPCVCSVSVSVSSVATKELVNFFSLSGVFLADIPVVDFIAYPETFIDEVNPQVRFLDSTNYNTSPGVYFYGEGHTENINLSSNISLPGHTTNWFIGNTATDVREMSSISWFGVSKTSSQEAITTIATTSLQKESYPINVWSTNTVITTAGPFLSYRDSDGEATFYPFFASSLTPQGHVDENKTTSLRGNIEVRQYPISTQYSQLNIQSPFNQSVFSLPLDYSTQTFKGSVNLVLPSGCTNRFLQEKILGTQWQVGASTTESSWEYSITPLTASIVEYHFNLSYDDVAPLTYLEFFKADIINPTTVNVSASVFVGVKINLAPYDWISRVAYTTTKNLFATVAPFPVVSLYIPNYYNLKNQDVSIAISKTPEFPLVLKRLSITSPSSDQTIVLTEEINSGVMQFQQLGTANLIGTALLHDVQTNTDKQISFTFSDMIEIIEMYDAEPIEEHFKSLLTPINFTHTEQPRLSPNEWAIADNINSVILKLNTTVDELITYSTLYEPKSKFYGWIDHKNTNVAAIRSLLWNDLKCIKCSTTGKSIGVYEYDYTWDLFTADVGRQNINFGSQRKWENNTCELKQEDPSCLGKYCLNWNWNLRKCGASEINISWDEAKCGNEFSKKWKFEKCSNASEPRNCKRDAWKLVTRDFSSFPVLSCNLNFGCTYVDISVGNLTNLIVVAYPTEIHIFNTNQQATTRVIQLLADSVYSFQNISGISINNEGLLFVLDKTIPRVSIFQINNEKLQYYTAWGTFGLASNTQGFYEPSDIHVDQENSVWIADTGNNCVKKFTINGKNLLTLTYETFKESSPLSISVDSKQLLHVLTEKEVLVFDQSGNYKFKYSLSSDITGVMKIRPSYNREVMYITHERGVVKYFRNGNIFEHLLQNYKCQNDTVLSNYVSTAQDLYRNVYVAVNDKLLKIADLQKNIETKPSTTKELFWTIDDLMIHKEEYIQPWVYLKSFHRLWDNIELLRNSLVYDLKGCKSFAQTAYQKTDITIGQNEIVTNSVINRLSEQLWTNLQSLINYFDPNCEN